MENMTEEDMEALDKEISGLKESKNKPAQLKEQIVARMDEELARGEEANATKLKDLRLCHKCLVSMEEDYAWAIERKEYCFQKLEGFDAGKSKTEIMSTGLKLKHVLSI